MSTLKEFTGQYPTPGATEQAVAQAIAFQTKETIVAQCFVGNLYSGIGHRCLTQYQDLGSRRPRSTAAVYHWAPHHEAQACILGRHRVGLHGRGVAGEGAHTVRDSETSCDST